MGKVVEIFSEVVTGVLALAIVAVLVKNGNQTASVVKASTGGFANMVGTAEKG